MTKSRMAALVALALLVACSIMPVAAQNEVVILGDEADKPVTDAEYIPEVFDIGIDGEMFFRIRNSAAGFTAAERARIINARIVHILSFAPVDPASVHVEAIRGKPTIYVGNVRLVTVYPNDVEATEAGSMWDLARLWAASTSCCLERVATWPNVAPAE